MSDLIILILREQFHKLFSGAASIPGSFCSETSIDVGQPTAHYLFPRRATGGAPRRRFPVCSTAVLPVIGVGRSAAMYIRLFGEERI